MTSSYPRLVLASENSGKIEEFREALTGLKWQLAAAREAGVTEFPDETGASYEENALIKAAHATLRSGLVSLADDSGLEVDALQGQPACTRRVTAARD